MTKIYKVNTVLTTKEFDDYESAKEYFDTMDKSKYNYVELSEVSFENGYEKGKSLEVVF